MKLDDWRRRTARAEATPQASDPSGHGQNTKPVAGKEQAYCPKTDRTSKASEEQADQGMRAGPPPERRTASAIWVAILIRDFSVLRSSLRMQVASVKGIGSIITH
jgi:hypothetical protein